MTSLHPVEGFLLHCDATTKVFLEKKNEELSYSERFIISSLKDNYLFIKPNAEGYVRALVDAWIDRNNTPKKGDEKAHAKQKH